MLQRDRGRICKVCGAYDFFSDEKLPHEYFCEHCFNVLDNWFDDLSSDLRTSVKAWRGRVKTDSDVLDALETFVEEKGRMINDSSKNG